MREIKFRAWDKRIDKMTDTFDLQGFASDQDSEWGDYELGSANEGEFVYMQYTGLKDKNDKEIYEGDIVEGENFGSRKMGVVHYFVDAWKEFRLMGAFVVFNHIKYGELESDGVDISVIENETKWSKKANCEVIGNIYENPELLKE